MAKRLLAGFLGLIAFMASSLALSAPASADTVTFRVQSLYQYKVQIEFYSQARDAAWPGNGNAYNLDDYDTHAFTLECNTGEQICYGAWVTGDDSQYWGVGNNNQYSCDSCCLVCGKGEGPVFTLNP